MALAATNCVHTANYFRNRLTETTAFKAYLLSTMCIKLFCKECSLSRLVISTDQWLICRKNSVGMPIESRGGNRERATDAL